MTTPKFSELAMKKAVDAKSSGLPLDIICDDGQPEAEFAALLIEAEAALPFAKYDHRVAAGYARAGADNRAEARAHRAFSCDR